MQKFLLIVILTLFVSSCTATTKSAQRKKEEADIHYRMGVVYLNEGKSADALKELSLAVGIEPDKALYHNALGLAYFSRRLPDRAIEHFKESIELDDTYSDAYLNLGAVYIEEGRWDLVIEVSKSVLENVYYKTPELAYNNIGWAYFKKGEFVNAIVNYKKAAELSPAYPMPYNNMGLAYERLGKPDKALGAYNTAISLNEGFVNPVFNKGMLLLGAEDYEGASEAFERVIELDPSGSLAISSREYLEIMR